MKSNLDCGECGANLCVHTKRHIEELGAVVKVLTEQIKEEKRINKAILESVKNPKPCQIDLNQ